MENLHETLLLGFVRRSRMMVKKKRSKPIEKRSEIERVLSVLVKSLNHPLVGFLRRSEEKNDEFDEWLDGEWRTSLMIMSSFSDEADRSWWPEDGERWAFGLTTSGSTTATLATGGFMISITAESSTRLTIWEEQVLTRLDNLTVVKMAERKIEKLERQALFWF